MSGAVSARRFDLLGVPMDGCLQIVLLHVGDRHLAHDLVAEAYTKAWTSWPKVRELEVPRAWVVRTALNTHASWWRRRRHLSLV